MVYYCQEFTIEEVIYVINGLKSNQKKFTIARLFTIDRFTITRFDCTWLLHIQVFLTLFPRFFTDVFLSISNF